MVKYSGAREGYKTNTTSVILQDAVMGMELVELRFRTTPLSKLTPPQRVDRRIKNKKRKKNLNRSRNPHGRTTQPCTSK